PVVAMIVRGNCSWSSKIKNSFKTLAGNVPTPRLVGVIIYDNATTTFEDNRDIYKLPDNDIPPNSDSFVPTLFLTQPQGQSLVSYWNDYRNQSVAANLSV